MSVTPRVNGAYLPSFLNQTVRVVGRIQSIDPSGAVQLTTSDNRPLTAFSAAVAQGEGGYDSSVYAVGQVVEMVGQVQEDGTLQEYIGVAFGTNFGQSTPHTPSCTSPPPPLPPSSHCMDG